jgi:hypothetical protein
MEVRTREAYQFDHVDEAFHEALECGLETLFDLVAALDLPACSAGVDVGCGRGE